MVKRSVHGKRSDTEGGGSRVVITFGEFYEFAIQRGVDPEGFWDLTLAQIDALIQRDHYLQKQEWFRTAQLLSLTYNLNRGSDNPRMKLEDFIPDTYLESRQKIKKEQFSEEDIELFQLAKEKWSKKK